MTERSFYLRGGMTGVEITVKAKQTFRFRHKSSQKIRGK
jgi:hypothetical protein